MKITKTMKFEIIKPIGNTWNELGETLRNNQYYVWKTYNKAVQMAWDFKNVSYGYKNRFGEVLKHVNLGEDVRTMPNYITKECRLDYPNIPAHSLNVAVRDAISRFNSEYKDVLRGAKSIPSFRRNMPIPIRAGMMKLFNEGGDYMLEAQMMSLEGAKELGLPTRFKILTKVGGSSKAIFDRMVSGEYSLRDSEITYDERRRKWYFSLAFQFEKTEIETDKTRIMGVDLGISNAAYMAFNFDKWLRYNIEGSEIITFRDRTEARRNQLLRQSKYAGEGRRGHGRKTLLSPIEKLRGRVANFRRTTNHKYSKYIVEMAEKHGAGVIQMEDLSGINTRSAFLKKWSYYELQQYVEYKAKEKGIDVKYIDPKYTSQRCSNCGHIAKGNRRSQTSFECSLCEYKTNADFNAAKNIALPDIEQRIKDEFERQEHKRKQLINA